LISSQNLSRLKGRQKKYVVGRDPMQDFIAVPRFGARPGVLVFSLMFLLGCAAGGCDAKPGTESGSAPVPPGIEKMKEQMKSQTKQQNRAKGRTQPGGQQGR
jgi:hypothetical protein